MRRTITIVVGLIVAILISSQSASADSGSYRAQGGENCTWYGFGNLYTINCSGFSQGGRYVNYTCNLSVAGMMASWNCRDLQTGATWSGTK